MFADLSLWELIKQGGISLIPLAVCSLLTLTVALERLWTYSRIGKAPQDVLKRVERLLNEGNWFEAIKVLDGANSPFARVVRAGMEKRQATPEERADLLAMASEVEVSHATRPLPILGTIGNIAPFIGLFGTVLGIMRAFNDVASMGSSNSSVVSKGIAEALIATGLGLGIGICAVVANNWCGAWVDKYRRELDHFSTRWFHRLSELGKGSDAAYQDNDPLLNNINSSLEPVA